MGENTGIAWCDATVNFWVGCRKVSAGCKNCYAAREMKRFGRDFGVVSRSKGAFRDPLRWTEPKIIFTCSWSDFFIAEADPWRPEAWDVIRRTPHHTWLILTKRPGRIPVCLPPDWGDGWGHVWLGVSAENQYWLDRRVPLLMEVPAEHYFLSAEPLLGELNLSTAPRPFDWVVAGGESGPSARPCEHAWIRAITHHCCQAGTPAFVKQLGSWWAGQRGASDPKAADPAEWPLELKVRQWPKEAIHAWPAAPLGESPS